MYQYFNLLTQESIQKNKESTLSILGITDPALRKVLGEQMSQTIGNEHSFLSSPIVEQMFAWQKAQPTLDELSGKLLSKSVIDALDKDSNGGYRFNKNFQPYVHQLQSWKSLLEEKKSIIVTSGTGSGKTECFMVPILNDLYEEFSQKGQALTGVNALFLYPLNALINSQQERLDAWTRNFDGKDAIRYCLYNGNTIENKAQVSSKQKIKPNQVLTREELRLNPPPILVTNGTMLEYMMVRQIDAPILQKSKGKLRWIVLDEAHSYMGSQAAELALQLRRVLHAFDVKAQDVRFVATSATIAGKDAEDNLKQFLSEVSGQSIDNIVVIGGQREVPLLPEAQKNSDSLDEISQMDEGNEVSAIRYNRLCGHPIALTLRNCLASHRALSTYELVDVVKKSGYQLSEMEILKWIDLLTYTKLSANDQAFLKARINYYQRVTQGLWSCISSKCSVKSIDLKNWKFGQVYVTHQEKCECGAPVLELTFCKECKEPHLLASLNKDSILKQWNIEIADEFALLLDNEDDEQDIENDKSIRNNLFVFSMDENKEKHYRNDKLNLDNFKLGEISNNNLSICYAEIVEWNTPICCSKPDCSSEGVKFNLPFNRAMLGAPFYITQMVPHLLQYCPDITQDEIDEAVKDNYDPEFVDGEFKELKDCSPYDMPAKGKRLITFTDSRQGTARLSVKMQQEAERSCLRGAVVKNLIAKTRESFKSIKEDPVLQFCKKKLQEAIEQNDQSKIKSLQDDIDELGALSIDEILPEVTWEELYTLLSKEFDFKNGILLANRHIAGEVFEDRGAIKLAQMLLTREFSRRPKNANSLETLGLVKLSYKDLKKLNDLPNYWKDCGLSNQDWQDFIKVILDFYIRENTVIDIEDEWKRWMGGPVRSKHVVSYEDKDKVGKRLDGSRNNRILVWPLASTSPNHRLVKLLVLGANLDISLKQHKNMADEWLKKAWGILKSEFLVDENNGRYHLKKEKLTFGLTDKVNLCPVTHRLMDTVFKGFTPYLPKQLLKNKERYMTKSLGFPKLWEYDLDNLSELEDKDLKLLKSLNLWTDLSDSAVSGGFFYRTAEHSAQQSSDILKRYETYFKAGKVNVLNCSTTMEMGVDIGGISTVVMNNVPPHPANYLQRTGRAGRGSQSRALSYTLCKNNPHDLQVFNNPLWAYTTPIKVPYVSFNSERLIQRHINAQLLSTFLIKEIGDTNIDRPKLDLRWFYLKEDGQDCSACDHFVKWLLGEVLTKYKPLIEFLKKDTVLEDTDDQEIVSNCVTKISQIQQEWLTEYTIVEEEYKKEYEVNPNSNYLYRLDCEKDRLTTMYLLSDLAMRNFLPSYGFPTDIITFDNTNKVSKDRWAKLSQKQRQQNINNKFDREDNLTRLKGLPSRNIAIAIREYAPGAEVIVDGRVYISKGISLSWQNIQNEYDKKPQKFDLAWKCHFCGQTGLEKEISVNAKQLKCKNSECGKEITDVKKVLKPNGFSVDFYDKPNNDVTGQQYIPVQKPWVGVSDKAETWALPHSSLGYINVDPDGHVFQYSSGLNGTGFAICMQCGRADSMENKQNGEDVYPNTLKPDRAHNSLKAQKDKSNIHECSGSGNVKAGIHLGCQMQTDVLEIVLKHPVRNEYILNDEDGKIIATTLVVALRQAIANKLGISTDELGYAVKAKKIEESTILVLQIYDDISGGAGFSTMAAQFIAEVFKELVTKLECDNTTCSTVCSQCLLDSTTRYDYENLDRILTLKWLGSEFLHYLDSPIPSATFIPGSPFSIVENYIRQGVKEIVFNLTGDSNDWDILCTEIRKKLFKILNNGIKVKLAVSSTLQVITEFQQEMLILEKIGILFAVKEVEQKEDIYAQLVLSDKVITLLNQDFNISVFNSCWLEGSSPNYRSIAFPILQMKDFSFDFKSITAYESNYQHIKILNDFDSNSVESFAQSFWDKVLQLVKLHSLVSDDPLIEVKYSDRYLQSPANIMLVSCLYGYLANIFDGEILFTIETFFKKQYHNKQIFVNSTLKKENIDSDFQDYNAHQKFFTECFYEIVGQNITVNISKGKIDHARYFAFILQSGREIYVRMDQGISYWRMQHLHDDISLKQKVSFPFSEEINMQIMWVKENINNISVSSVENFATDIYLSRL